MTRFFRKTGVKVFAGILCILFFTAAIASLAGVVLLGATGCYSGENQLFRTLAMEQMSFDSWDVLGNYFDPEDPTHPWKSYYSGGIYDGTDSNFVYKIVDLQTGEAVLSSFTGKLEVLKFHTYNTETWSTPVAVPEERDEKAYCSLESDVFRYDGMLYVFDPEQELFQPVTENDNEGIYEMPQDVAEYGFYYGDSFYALFDSLFMQSEPEQVVNIAYTNHEYGIYGYLRAGLPYHDRYSDMKDFSDTLYLYRYSLVGLCIGAGLLGVFLLILLCCVIGHTNRSDEIVINPIYRLPLDLMLVAVFLLLGMGVGLCIEMDFWSYPALAGLCAGAGILAAAAGCVYYIVSLAVHAKTHTVLKCTILYWCFKNCRRFLRWCKRWALKAISVLPLMWKVAAGYLAICFVEFLIMGICGAEGPMWFFWFVEKVLLGAAVAYVTMVFRRLKTGAETIAAGDYNTKVSDEHMILDFKDTANTLNHIRDGMNAAVDSRMKSEHLKTELITNVSHDIKTPLTSIVSYVDLLKKEPMESENAKEYLTVLDRQSQRLKKLVEDLVEASKASTGNIPVQLGELELDLLLEQALGEYAERLETVNVVPVLQKSKENVTVLADGRLLWRVFDNLLGNVVKYALPGTRLYVSLTAGETARVTFRNISREPLNISEEELMERFVRGDSSRHTEGSGLGLSIARSLTESMGGTFSLLVDGDLFKAIVEFPLGTDGGNG